MRIVVMGVSGSGKSTVGAALAERLGVPFVDGDDLHPATNVAKMAAGIPLDDDDREPWLDAVGERMRSAAPGVVVACSALRRSYRDRIRAAVADARFVYLEVPPSVLEQRLHHRPGHFMPASLLASQLATLESPGLDEHAIVIDATEGVERAADEIVAQLRP
jgi:gluconokinase